MARNRHGGATLTAVVALALTGVTGLTGCSDDGSPSSVASKAASAVESLGSQAASSIASATAEAGRRLDEVKNGVDAKDAVKLGTPATDSAGRSTVEVTAHNTAGSAKSFAVQVEFKNTGGNLIDTVVVTVSDVPAGKSGTATARSNRKLSGGVKAEVGRALRY
ncbi:hypothetical protein ABZT04_03145 [Streptomyces sp. NPDC005492]|uniref:hypothetical protein n=1 Tax=Streptomyces sp. NPDC005492 TaxID=3156883 RepID=UPI0033BB2EFE